MHLVFLHGPAAAGKLTVARALSQRLHYGVFHNHLVVDALTAVFPFGTPPFVELREHFWLSTFRAAALADVSLLFTFAPEATVQPGFAERARACVADAGGRTVFVELTVGEAEQERRIALPSRSEFAKLTSVETLRQLRAARTDVERPPADLRIDTETTGPEAAADRVVEHFGLRPAASWDRYPAVQPPVPPR
ncbi:nucleoside/nucleotide kinase family protein [Auraticoccus cholistanensis]|uniref:hypothetical protein n=1 Tax=Auraticoccus cholistanensis TaxID=2656650 RepID=UPI0018D25C30|nr:hypothetical protein [Auraticoccus cholistanensis]